jgi:YidC/Oxa1 family membrane protein insertase
VSNPLDYLYEAVGWVFTHIYDAMKPLFGATSGWTWLFSIAILVILMRLIMVPLFVKQMHTTRAMSSLQPQMAALRKKYKNDKQTLNQETMKLYQEAGVNPLMGCLPFVLQLPLFFSLFSVLRAIAEYTGGTPKYGLPKSLVVAGQHAKILGASIADKVLFTGTAHVPVTAKLVILLFVAISMATTFLTIRQSQKRGMMPAATPDNPMANSQKYMTYIMPFFALTGLYWPFGLVLYWVTTNLWTMGQQYILGRRYPYTPPVPVGDGAATSTPATARALTSGGARNTAKKPAAGSSAAKGTGPANSAGRPAPAKGTGTGSPAGRSASSTGPKPGRAAANGATANGSGGAGSTLGSSVLRRLGRGGGEPEPQPDLPEVKLVRRQTQRQSRSKRSGKR